MVDPRLLLASLALSACASCAAPPTARISPPREEPPFTGITPIRLDDLPLGVVFGALPKPNPPEPGPAPGEPTDDLLLETPEKATPTVHTLRVKAAVISTIWEDGAQPGAHVLAFACGGTTHPSIGPLRWATLQAQGDSVELVINDGWIDYETCVVTSARRLDVQIAPLIPGVLYAYRDESSLVLVFPGTSEVVTNEEPLQSLASDKGTLIRLMVLPIIDRNVSFAAKVDARPWIGALHPRHHDAVFARLALVNIGLEVTRSSRDPNALAIAYVLPPRRASPSVFELFEEHLDFEPVSAPRK